MKRVLEVTVVFEESGEKLDRLLWQILCQHAVFWQDLQKGDDTQ